jgi:hypothetical protein
MSKYYQEASEGCCLTCIFKDTPSAKLGFQKPLTALCFAGFLIHADEIQAHVVFPSNYLSDFITVWLVPPRLRQ